MGKMIYGSKLYATPKSLGLFTLYTSLTLQTDTHQHRAGLVQRPPSEDLALPGRFVPAQPSAVGAGPGRGGLAGRTGQECPVGQSPAR